MTLIEAAALRCATHTHRGLTYGRTVKCNRHHPFARVAGPAACSVCRRRGTVTRDGNALRFEVEA